MKKATKADIYFIQNNPESMDIGGLSKVTGLTNTQVKHILEKSIPENMTKESAVSTNIETQFDKSVAKHKSRKGVIMMTEGASQLVDSARPYNRPKDTSSFITKARK